MFCLQALVACETPSVATMSLPLVTEEFELEEFGCAINIPGPAAWTPPYAFLISAIEGLWDTGIGDTSRQLIGAGS